MNQNELYPEIHKRLMPTVEEAIVIYNGHGQGLDGNKLNNMVDYVVARSGILRNPPRGHSRNSVNDFARFLLLCRLLGHCPPVTVPPFFPPIYRPPVTTPIPVPPAPPRPVPPIEPPRPTPPRPVPPIESPRPTPPRPVPPIESPRPPMLPPMPPIFVSNDMRIDEPYQPVTPPMVIDPDAKG